MPRTKGFLTTPTALVELLIEQTRLDVADGKHTEGVVAGYPGSPLGGVFGVLEKARDRLAQSGIRHIHAINEDLAVNILWGAQQACLEPRGGLDGAFGLWYGKGPGLDRALDALKHANYAGTARWGGVVAVVGDDPHCRSSTLPHQADPTFMAAGIPILAPATVEDILRFGLHGFALSRYAGVWVGLKTPTDLAESCASVDYSFDTAEFPKPGKADVHIRWPEIPREMEKRLVTSRAEAIQTYAKLAGLDKIVQRPAGARLGIAAVGKSWTDVLEALRILKDEFPEEREALDGIALAKIGLAWPLVRHTVNEFSMRLDEIVVVEEKRPLVETQWREQFKTVRGKDLFPCWGELTPDLVADGLATVLGLRRKSRAITGPALPPKPPAFCGGCPHARSTKVPEGSIAYAGIGCHAIAGFSRPTETRFPPQMGGEGVNFIGYAPFGIRNHAFVNMGDGTWLHSGSLAVRQAVLAGADITFKILCNGTVAMTGGQPLTLDAGTVARQLTAEGVGRLWLLTEEAEALGGTGKAEIRHVDEIAAVQDEARRTPGVSAIVFDRGCGLERLRDAKTLAAMDAVTIVADACTNCGACAEFTGCPAIVPVMTEEGPKRTIDQEACSRDYSCLSVACPAFVTLPSVVVRKLIKEPPRVIGFPLTAPFATSVLWAGVGGAGVVTAARAVSLAAMDAGLSILGLNQTGLSQKNGSVLGHLRMGDNLSERSLRLARGEAHLLLALDLDTARTAEALERLAPNAIALVDSGPGNPGTEAGFESSMEVIRGAVGDVHVVPATRIAKELAGAGRSAAFVLIGYAWRSGWLPFGRADIEGRLPPAEANHRAFTWGALYAESPGTVESVLTPQPKDLRGDTARQARRLALYGNAQDVLRHEAFVAELAGLVGTERAAQAGDARLNLAAPPDEYEVARILSRRQARAYRLTLPIFGRVALTGSARLLLAGLARLKGLRNTAFDPFRNKSERQADKTLLAAFERIAIAAARAEDFARLDAVVKACDEVRGYGEHRRERQRWAADVLGIIS